MTYDEMQRMMKFIVERQAQVAASLQRKRKEHVTDPSRVERLEESFQLLRQLAQKHGLT